MMLCFVLFEKSLAHLVCLAALDIIQTRPSKLAFVELFRLSEQAGPELTGAAIARLMGY